jgi:hypothetical protein
MPPSVTPRRQPRGLLRDAVPKEVRRDAVPSEARDASACARQDKVEGDFFEQHLAPLDKVKRRLYYF